MTADQPTITPRAAHVAVLLLDTRVAGRYVPRDTYRKVPPPPPLTARRIAVRLSDAVGEPITADDVIAGGHALRTLIPSYELRAIAAATPEA